MLKLILVVNVIRLIMLLKVNVVNGNSIMILVVYKLLKLMDVKNIMQLIIVNVLFVWMDFIKLVLNVLLKVNF